MEIVLNYWAILVCAVVSMVIGAIWYGPLFGKKWAEIVGATKMDKAAVPLYAVQFLLTLFQVYVLAHFIKGWQDASALEASLWIFAAFILPIVAGGAMWNNDSKRIAWMRFLIQFGYQLILFVIFGLVLGMWQ